MRPLSIALTALALVSCTAAEPSRAARDAGPKVPHDSGLEQASDGAQAQADARVPEPADDAATSAPELPLAPFDAIAPWLTRMGGVERLTRLADIPFETTGTPGELTVNAQAPLQAIDGFGASLTDSSAYLLAKRLSDAGRRTLLARLFDRTGGIGLNMLRQTMGASDFALATYSYDDTAPDLSDFSIDYERAYMLPLLREVQALSPELKLIASPWSPPGWMKTSGKMVGGTLLPTAYSALADYFVVFLGTYRAEGLSFWAITPQNEPEFDPPGYPGMKMSAAEQATFIGKHLGPALVKAGLGAKILVWDHNWNKTWYPLDVYKDEAARDFAAGAAFHCYEGEVSAQSEVHAAHPDKDLWLTECSAGEWVGDDAANFARDMRELIIGGTTHWARAVIKWNLALDQINGPRNGGCTTCFGTVRVHNEAGVLDRVELNSEFYSFGHVSKFLGPGAHRIESTWTGASALHQVAFANGDGARVLVLFNEGAALAFTLRDGDKRASITVPAESALTLYWGAPPPALDGTAFTAKASSSVADKSPALALDGDPSTRWSHDGAGDSAWFELDLGSEQRVSALTIDGGIAGPWVESGYALFAMGKEGTLGGVLAQGEALSGLETVRFPRQELRSLRLVLSKPKGAAWSISEVQVHP